MASQGYSVNQHLIKTMLVWVKSGEIGITELEDLRKNFEENAVPQTLLSDHSLEYFDFLTVRRMLITRHLKKYYKSL